MTDLDLKSKVAVLYKWATEQEGVFHENFLLEVYRLAQPGIEWEQLRETTVTCDPSTWDVIHEAFAHYDKIHHPNCAAGAYWVNKGFTVDLEAKPWSKIP